MSLPGEELSRITSLLHVEDETTRSVLEALLENIHRHYHHPPLKTHYEPDAAIMAKVPMATGGNPILLTQVYKGADHSCYITFFLAPLIGYELSFRVAAQKEEEPQQFFSLADLRKNKREDPERKELLNLLINLVNHTLFSNEYYDDQLYHIKYMADWFGNSIRAVLFLKDPVLQEVHTAAGNVKYIQILGLTQQEYELLSDPENESIPDQQRAEAFIQERMQRDPYLVTIDK
jgi:hypothetical protein